MNFALILYLTISPIFAQSRDYETRFDRAVFELVKGNCSEEAYKDSECRVVSNSNAVEAADSSVKSIRRKILNEQEAPFFRDFSKHQLTETNCELSLLDKLDAHQRPISQAGACKGNLAASIQSAMENLNTAQNLPQARKLQTQIAEKIWEVLPALKASDEKIDRAEDELTMANLAIANQAVARNSESGRGLLLPKLRAVRNAKEQQLLKEKTIKSALESSLWSGTDPRMKALLASLRRKFKDFSPAKKEEFLNVVARSDDRNYSLQTKVIGPMRVEATCRRSSLEGMKSWSEDPTRQSDQERNLKSALMSTPTVFEFMASHPSYKGMQSELSCHLNGGYKGGEELIYLGADVGMTVLSLGAGGFFAAVRAGKFVQQALWLRKFSAVGPIAATVLGSATGYLSDCASFNSILNSTTGSSSCGPLSQASESALPEILSEQLENKSCQTAVLLAALGGVAEVGALAANLSKNADRVLHARRVLNRNRDLTATENAAIILSHEVGENELGRNGLKASIGNYTFPQLRRKHEILRGAGFSNEEIRVLMENDIVGHPPDDLTRLGLVRDNRAPPTRAAVGRNPGQRRGDVATPDMARNTYLKGDAEANRRLVDPTLTSRQIFDETKFLSNFVEICKKQRKSNCDQVAAAQFNQVELAFRGLTPQKDVIADLVSMDILSRSIPEMQQILGKKGFRRVQSCMNGDCSRPMVFFVHESGVSIKIKPNGSDAVDYPHSSIFITDLSKEYVEGVEALQQTSDPKVFKAFGARHLDGDAELAKVDPITGRILPRGPLHINYRGLEAFQIADFKKAIMDLVHPRYQNNR